MPDPIEASPLWSLTPADLESLQPDLEAYYAPLRALVCAQ